MEDDPKYSSPMLAYLETVKNAELAALDGRKLPASQPLPADPSPMDVYLHSMEQQHAPEPPTHCLTCGRRLKKKERPRFYPDFLRVVK
jgi:hypothetical protein